MSLRTSLPDLTSPDARSPTSLIRCLTHCLGWAGQKALRFGDSGDPRRVRQTDGVQRSRGAFPAQCEVCFPQITTPPTNP